MRILSGGAERGPLVSGTILIAAVAAFPASVLTNAPLDKVVPVLAVIVLAVVSYKHALRWRTLLAAAILTAFYIPIRKYTLPSSLPFELEPYRVVLGFLLLGWLTSLLIDPRVRLRKAGFDTPLLAFILVALCSLIVNGGRVADLSHVLAKKLTFFGSFVLLVYAIVSVSRRFDVAQALVKVLVVGGSGLALGAVIEHRTGFNVFAVIPRAIPGLHVHQVIRMDASTDNRGAGVRAVASAETAIELGAILVMLVPLAVALARSTGKRRWWLAVCVLLPGAVGSISRTTVLMLVAVVLVSLRVRPRETRRLWPALLPLVVVIHMAVPGALGSLGQAFFPKQGLLAQQANTPVGSGRIATLGPALAELGPDPVLGEGWATRVTTHDEAGTPPNGPILDDQWLGVLLETGIVGLLTLGWLFVHVVRKLMRAARDDPSPRGWLLAGMAASIAAYAVGMLTYDSFSFLEVTLVLFVVLGLAGATLASPRPGAPA
jgi:polysaccharide biosynthesis protein PslJ